MAQARVSTIQQEREEVFAAWQYAASFHCLVEEWKDCEELKPKPKVERSGVLMPQPKREVELRGQKQKGHEPSDGVVCHSKQVSVHEMWKRHQVHEITRKMCRTQVVDKRQKTQVQKMVIVA